MSETMTLEQFAKSFGGVTEDDIQRITDKFHKKLAEMKRSRDYTIERYEHAVKNGFINKPTETSEG